LGQRCHAPGVLSAVLCVVPALRIPLTEWPLLWQVHSLRVVGRYWSVTRPIRLGQFPTARRRVLQAALERRSAVALVQFPFANRQVGQCQKPSRTAASNQANAGPVAQRQDWANRNSCVASLAPDRLRSRQSPPHWIVEFRFFPCLLIQIVGLPSSS
jgi:hypothetical protein